MDLRVTKQIMVRL